MEKNKTKTMCKTIGIGLVTMLVSCGMTNVSACVTDIWAGQNYIAGTVSISYWQTTYLRIEYQAGDGWTITESHLAIGETFDDIPQTHSGSPKVGQFPYKNNDAGPTHTYYIDLYSLFPSGNWHGQTLYFAAHCVIENPLYGSETGWADTMGIPFPGSNNALYFILTLP